MHVYNENESTIQYEYFSRDNIIQTIHSDIYENSSYLKTYIYILEGFYLSLIIVGGNYYLNESFIYTTKNLYFLICFFVGFTYFIIPLIAITLVFAFLPVLILIQYIYIYKIKKHKNNEEIIEKLTI